MDILLRGYIKAALWAFLVITVLIVIDFRNAYAALLTLLPLIVGMIWMVGVMVTARIDFNPANIMVLPLIVGIGVAYGIYVVQRYRESHEATFYSKSTGRAVILSALTTTFAFASLLVGAHRGIRSLGLVMTIGVIACLIAALALLPALLETARARAGRYEPAVLPIQRHVACRPDPGDNTRQSAYSDLPGSRLRMADPLRPVCRAHRNILYDSLRRIARGIYRSLAAVGAVAQPEVGHDSERTRDGGCLVHGMDRLVVGPDTTIGLRRETVGGVFPAGRCVGSCSLG